MDALAEFVDVHKEYEGRSALGPLTLTLPQTSLGLLGPNGAGKTTFLRLLLGVIPPTSGTVRVFGEDVRKNRRSVLRRIGYVPEGEAIFPSLSGVEAVAYAGRLSGMGRADAFERAHKVLDYVDLGEARYRLVEKYSAGMRQRLKLAQALVHDPEFLVLDEPTEGVDPEARLKILEILRDLSKEYGIKILISTHILHDVEELATHAVVLHEGSVVASGSLEDLRRSERKGFVVQVEGPRERFLSALTTEGREWEDVGEGRAIVLVSDPAEVFRIARGAGCVVRHLAPLKLTLEEAFEQAITAAREEVARSFAGGG